MTTKGAGLLEAYWNNLLGSPMGRQTDERLQRGGDGATEVENEGHGQDRMGRLFHVSKWEREPPAMH